MISKSIGTSSLASLLLISSVSALPMETGSIDQRTVLFDSASGCARCIRGGYTFVYKDLNTATVSGESIASGDYDSKNVCCNGENCGDKDLSKMTGQLTSAMFTSLDVALLNCPHKVEVCGDKNATLAKITDKTTLSVVASKMTQKDSCHWIVKTTCGVPEVTLTTLGGAFADATKAGLSYIEYASTPNTSSRPPTFDDQSDFLVGELFDMLKDKYYGDANAVGINMGGKGGIMSPTPGFMIEKLVKEANTAVDTYLTAAGKFKTDLIAYEARLLERAKAWIEIQFMRDTTLTTPKVRYPYTDAGALKRPWPEHLPAPVAPELPPLYKGLTGASASFYGGYGTLTAGTITLKALDKKFYGVLGQGVSSSDLGYVYPPEKSDACVAKYIGFSLYPIVADGTTWTAGSGDTFTLTVESKAAAVKTVDPSISATNKKDIMGGAALQKQKALLSEKFRTYDQWQYKNEYLGASTVAAGAIAATTLAALTLY